MSTYRTRGLLFLLMLSILSPVAFGTTPNPSPTVTTLAISATSVAYQTPIILTATVTSGNSPISAGLVLFCEATAKYCENNSALGIAQLSFPAATASVKIGSGPIGNHSYKAVFRANENYAGSVSNTVTYAVIGTYGSSTALASSGTIGNYSLQATVDGAGSLNTGPTGNISFLDTSTGNSLLGTENLVVTTLSTTFVQEPPFAIGVSPTKTQRSQAIASAYLDSDNNLDVVTADFQNDRTQPSTISVLLGNGDGTFKTKINYLGCVAGQSAVQIVLADFNRDGITDIALGCTDAIPGSPGIPSIPGVNGGLVILLGSGGGAFEAPVYYPTGDAASIAIGDFNNDGIFDVALTDDSQSNVIAFLGDGTGKFVQQLIPLVAVAHAHGIVVSDFNMDGKDDIAFAVDTLVPNSQLSDLYLALGNGDGTFQATGPPVATQIGEFLTAGDTNADDFPDIVSTTVSEPGTNSPPIGNSLFVLLGNGKGAFQTSTYVADIPSDPNLADVNGDGIPDIIAGGSTGALVYIGNGDGTFQPYQEPGIGGFNYTYAVNAGDYNNDGNADLIGTDYQNPLAAVTLSQVQQVSVASALTSVAVFPLGSGVHNVDASYSGDSVYIGSLSTTVPLIAAPVNTALSLTSSSTSSILLGQSVVLTAVLSPYTVGPPTTTTNGELVEFFSGSTALGSSKLSNGVATLTTTSLPIGSDSLSAAFAGDSNYNPSNSNTVTTNVSNVLLNSSLNPSTFLQSVTFTATVANGKTGTINFFDGVNNIGSGVISGGIATFTTSSLLAATHNITAQYSSNSSSILAQVVNKATPTVSVTTSGPSTYGDTITITASVPSSATGTIVFTSGALALGSGTISGGVASVTTNLLTPPSDLITATYGGDSNYSSAVGTTTQSVAKLSPTSTLTSSINPSVPGGSVVFTDSLSANVTGTVNFSSGSTALGTSTVTNGVATVTTSGLPLGNNLITAVYSGDGNDNSSSVTLTQVVAKLNPTVTVTTSGSSIYGHSVTITASVPTGPTGTITIVSGGVTLGSGTITSTAGTVIVNTATLPVGNDLITANYGGDNLNNPATGSTTQTVMKASPTETISSSINPSTANQSVVFTASVPSNVTGNVTFTNGSNVLGTSTVVNGIATISSSTLPIGPDTITATYNGDANNSTATATLTQTVNKATPTVNVTTSGSSTYGSPVTITATVPPGTTGTITITSNGAPLGSGTVNPTTGTVTITTTALPIGSDPITASYGGDTNDNPATGTTTQTVTKATPVVTLTSSTNPSAANQSVTFTASLPSGVTGTVTFTAGSTFLGTSTLASGTATISSSSLPTGSELITATYNGDTNNNSATANLTQVVGKTTPPVTVTTSGSSTYGGSVTITTTVPPGTTGTIIVTSGGVTLGTGTVNPITGTVTITTTTLPVGSDPITSSYGGDTNNNPATGTTTQIVNKVSPTETLSSSINPSVANQVVVFTASVPSNATGTVTFNNGSTVLGTTALSNGVATLSTSTLPIGSDSITAIYNGDANDNSATAKLTQIVNKATPTVVVTTSGSSTYGNPVTITTTVPPGTTGTITVTSGGVTLGSGTVNPTTGTVTITTTTLPVGNDPITASYGGDTNDNPATGTTTQIVTKATPVLPPPVVSSANLPPNTPETITETVPPGVTGTVTFSDGTTSLGSATIVNGVATLTVPSLPLGVDSITAATSGDANNNPAVSPPTLVTVGKTSSVVTLTSSANPSALNQSVTFSAAVHSGATGLVTFLDGSTTLGMGVLNNSGVATFSTSALTIGSHPITASYGGDSSYSSSISSVLTQIVSRIPTVITITESTPAQLIQTGITFTANVTASSPNATGTVTFMDGTTILGTATLSSNGGVAVSLSTNANAALMTSSLAMGPHQIIAIYSGDATFAPSTSAPANDIVEDFTNTNSGPASQNVFPGASTSYNFSLAPTSAATFLSNVTIKVTGLPAGSTYTFTPSAVAAGSGVTAVVLNVRTSSSLSAKNQPSPGTPFTRNELPIATGMLSLLGLGTIRRLRQKMPRALMLVLLALGSLLPLVALSGCAGGYFTLTPTTYTVTVTGVEGTVQHAATATLIVQ